MALNADFKDYYYKFQNFIWILFLNLFAAYGLHSGLSIVPLLFIICTIMLLFQAILVCPVKVVDGKLYILTLMGWRNLNNDKIKIIKKYSNNAIKIRLDKYSIIKYRYIFVVSRREYNIDEILLRFGIN